MGNDQKGVNGITIPNPVVPPPHPATEIGRGTDAMQAVIEEAQRERAIKEMADLEFERLAYRDNKPTIVGLAPVDPSTPLGFRPTEQHEVVPPAPAPATPTTTPPIAPAVAPQWPTTASLPATPKRDGRRREWTIITAIITTIIAPAVFVVYYTVQGVQSSSIETVSPPAPLAPEPPKALAVAKVVEQVTPENTPAIVPSPPPQTTPAAPSDVSGPPILESGEILYSDTLHRDGRVSDPEKTLALKRVLSRIKGRGGWPLYSGNENAWDKGFDPDLAAAVWNLQSIGGLRRDGGYGPETAEFLKSNFDKLTDGYYRMAEIRPSTSKKYAYISAEEAPPAAAPVVNKTAKRAAKARRSAGALIDAEKSAKVPAPATPPYLDGTLNPFEGGVAAEVVTKEENTPAVESSLGTIKIPWWVKNPPPVAKPARRRSRRGLVPKVTPSALPTVTENRPPPEPEPAALPTPVAPPPSSNPLFVKDFERADEEALQAEVAWQEAKGRFDNDSRQLVAERRLFASVRRSVMGGPRWDPMDTANLLEDVGDLARQHRLAELQQARLSARQQAAYAGCLLVGEEACTVPEPAPPQPFPVKLNGQQLPCTPWGAISGACHQ